MRSNVGGIDRTLRIVAGVALLSFAVLGDGGARWWGLIGLVPLATGLSGYCPLYIPFGWSTRPAKSP